MQMKIIAGSALLSFFLSLSHSLLPFVFFLSVLIYPPQFIPLLSVSCCVLVIKGTQQDNVSPRNLPTGS